MRCHTVASREQCGDTAHGSQQRLLRHDIVAYSSHNLGKRYYLCGTMTVAGRKRVRVRHLYTVHGVKVHEGMRADLEEQEQAQHSQRPAPQYACLFSHFACKGMNFF